MYRLFTAKVSLKLGLGLAFIASLIVIPAIGQGREVKQTEVPAMTQMQDEKVTVNGKVKAVSATSLTIVDDQSAEHTITLDEKTKITKAGKAATAADLKENDAVVVVANKGEGDAMTAVTVTVS